MDDPFLCAGKSEIEHGFQCVEFHRLAGRAGGRLKAGPLRTLETQFELHEEKFAEHETLLGRMAARQKLSGLFFAFAVDFKQAYPDFTLPFEPPPGMLDKFDDWLQDREDAPRSAFQRWLANMPASPDTSLAYGEQFLKVQDDLRGLADRDWDINLRSHEADLLRALAIEMSGVIGGRGARLAAALPGDPLIQACLDLNGDLPRFHTLLGHSALSKKD